MKRKRVDFEQVFDAMRCVRWSTRCRSVKRCSALRTACGDRYPANSMTTSRTRNRTATARRTPVVGDDGRPLEIRFVPTRCTNTRTRRRCALEIQGKQQAGRRTRTDRMDGWSSRTIESQPLDSSDEDTPGVRVARQIYVAGWVMPTGAPLDFAYAMVTLRVIVAAAPGVDGANWRSHW